jgi:hypothetical protein
MEGVEAGLALLVPPEIDRIVPAVCERLDATEGRLPNNLRIIYGDGRAGLRSACFIVDFLSLPRLAGAPSCLWEEGHGEYRYSLPMSHDIPLQVNTTDPTAERMAVQVLESMTLSDHPNLVFRKRYLPGRLSVILTQYKRNTTESQLRAIFRQTAVQQIDRIVIVPNEEYVDLSFLNSIDFSDEVYFGGPEFKSRIRDLIQVVKSPKWNTKYFGRFALPLLFDTEFCAIFDDDTIPQPRFLEAALALSAKKNAIVGPVGVIVGDSFQLYISPPLSATVEVNLNYYAELIHRVTF